MIMAAIMAIMFVYASSKTKALTDKVGRSQGIFYGNQLSVKFAQRLRWSYDVARADALNTALNLCSSYPGGGIVTVGSISLCLINSQVCVSHPQNLLQPVCISNSDATIIAYHRPELRFSNWAALTRVTVDSANAQNLYEPTEPPAGATTNDLTVRTNACIGGDCRAQCGANADCLTFKFCPLVGGACETNQMVWQTVAFIK
jgi:hypothetical protein